MRKTPPPDRRPDPPPGPPPPVKRERTEIRDGDLLAVKTPRRLGQFEERDLRAELRNWLDAVGLRSAPVLILPVGVELTVFSPAPIIRENDAITTPKIEDGTIEADK